MRWTKFGKCTMALLLIFCGLIFAGFASKEQVKFFKKDLIDLDKAIDIASWGDDENNSQDVENSDEKSSEEPDSVSDANVGSYNIRSAIKVRVNGKKIYINDEECKEDEIEKKLKTIASGAKKVWLEDDYAEAHVYRNAREVIMKLSELMEFEYDER